MIAALVIGGCGGKLASTGDGGPDGSLADAPTSVVDAKPPVDGIAPPPPPPTDGGVPLVCPPAPVGTVTSAWSPPKRVPNACSKSDIDAFWQVCLSPKANQQSCQGFQQKVPNCLDCLTSASNEPQWGPLVSDQTGLVFLNEGGCVALVTKDPSLNGCGAAVNQLRQCTLESCADCPLNAPEDLKNLDACMKASEVSTCQSFQAKAACGNKLAPQCMPGPDFETTYKAIAPLFCGP
jgi:hypothetical protein